MLPSIRTRRSQALGKAEGKWFICVFALYYFIPSTIKRFQSVSTIALPTICVGLPLGGPHGDSPFQLVGVYARDTQQRRLRHIFCAGGMLIFSVSS